MKAYGHTRKEKLTCVYGCCDVRKGSKLKLCRKVADRNAKKRERKKILVDDAD